MPLRLTESPKLLVIRIEGLSVDHGIYRVDTLEVATQKDISLQLVRENGDDLGQAAIAGPIVGKGMRRSDTKDIGGSRMRVGHIRQKTRGPGHVARGVDASIAEVSISNIWYH